MGCLSPMYVKYSHIQGRIYLIDAGPNIVHSLTALGMSTNKVEGIFHTHVHLADDTSSEIILSHTAFLKVSSYEISHEQ